MEQNKKAPEPQGDFFDQLMFGPPPGSMTENEQQVAPENDESPNPELSDSTNPNTEQMSNQETSQLEHIIQIAQVVGPYLSKLSPMLSNLQSFFSNKK
ncbi:hypothetical protein [Alkalihalobacterium chitinilyticum]|uniref:Uncharacterized protein n=1 Tax=Alkalihalobacterium chitinilyticum TaxID=2980103 RepID=A0ABT5VAU9_9BACI|nr:hypothetical protein [Alkalihalobacterium chitinilyticum]MDE5412601.1 hypothetical protein [Alkalihalobacterium chitinilyticum]